MPKMTLERFREIKARIAEIKEKVDNEEIEISDEEEEQLGEELENFDAEIHSSDLSDIPYEEYQGFYDYGFDFEGTGANLDFEIIESSSSGIVRLKGCNIRNFNFDEQRYDEKSFDEEFIQEHEDKFLDRSIPFEARQRYYRKILTLADIVSYEFPDEDLSERIDSREIQKLLDRVSLEVIKSVGVAELFSNYNLKSTIITKIDEFEGEITEQILEDLMRESIEECLSDRYLSVAKYKEIISLQKVRDLIPEESIIDFGDETTLEEHYVEQKLTISEIVTHQEIFREKRFIGKLYRSWSERNSGQDRYEGITEERVYYLIDNFPEIAEVLSSHPSDFIDIARKINPELDKEENLSVIQEAVNDIIHNKDINGHETYESRYKVEERRALERYYTIEQIASSLSENSKHYFDIIMKYTTPEKIASYGITSIDLEDQKLLYLFAKYGLETVMEFDKANGNFLSKDNFALAKKIDDYYFHYAHGHSKEHTIFFRAEEPEDYDQPYTIEDFEENIRRMIVYGPTDGNHSKEQPIDYRDFSDKFKARFPEMFLDDSAPDELKDKFYTKKLTLEDVEKNPEWAIFLDGKDLKAGMRLPILMNFITNRDSKYISLYDILEKFDSSKSNVFNFLFNNSKLIKILEMNYDKYAEIELEGIENLDELKIKIEDIIEKEILSGRFYYGEPYILDSFKENHPELVLDDDAPKELKMKYYSLYYEDEEKKNLAYDQKLKLTDLVKEEYYPFLVGKSFDLSRSKQVRDITKFFDIDAIIEFCKTNPEGYKVLQCLEMYNFDFSVLNPKEMENIKSLEELMPKFEEFIEKQILSGGFEYGEMTILDSFRERHPEFVLSEDAPEELKAKFYSIYYKKGEELNTAGWHNFTIADLANEEYRPYLVGKSFDLLKSSEQVKNITKIFDINNFAS